METNHPHRYLITQLYSDCCPVTHAALPFFPEQSCHVCFTAKCFTESLPWVRKPCWFTLQHLLVTCSSLCLTGKRGKEKSLTCTSPSFLVEKIWSMLLNKLNLYICGILWAVLIHLKAKLRLWLDSNVFWVSTGCKQITPVTVAVLGEFY